MRSKWPAVLLLLATCATAQDYKIAQPGYKYAFPRDYFSHDDYQTEWWYYTGNVRAADGHRFGFELTFFRQGVSRATRTQPWFVNDLWMAHIALSDITGQRFLQRGAAQSHGSRHCRRGCSNRTWCGTAIGRRTYLRTK